MSGLARSIQRWLRTTFGEGSTIERHLRRWYRQATLRGSSDDMGALERKVRAWASTAQFRVRGEYTSRNFTVFGRGSGQARVGIFMLGACDLPSVFAAKPFIEADLAGVCAILRDGEVADARSDFILQALEGVDEQVTQEVTSRLGLPKDAFAPRLFQPTFELPLIGALQTFPKSVVVLSIAADLTRTMYRHKEHGYLIDPGGWWLTRPLDQVMANFDRVNWLRENLTGIGRITVDEFAANMRRIIKEVQTRTGATVLVFNSLVVTPGDLTHNYQFVRNSGVIRRMEFQVALAELARELDFSIVDVDRILKEQGVREQVDFAHFPMERMVPIAREVHRIIKDRGLLDGAVQPVATASV